MNESQRNKTKSMRSNKHLSVEYLYADHVFGYGNWSHEIKKIKLASS